MTLPDYIQSKMSEPFKWGAHDCMTFTIGWAEQVCGHKLLPTPLWNSQMQALRRVKREGGLEAVFDRAFIRIDAARAVDGDVTVCDGVASVFSGRHIVSVGKSGIAPRPRSLATCAWRIE